MTLQKKTPVWYNVTLRDGDVCVSHSDPPPLILTARHGLTNLYFMCNVYAYKV